MILKNYISKDIYKTTGAILLVLIMIFVSTRFVRYIRLAVDGSISSEAVFSLISLQIPAIAGFLLPLALFLAILITFGRLYSDNELVVVHSLGLGQKDLARMLMPMALWLALISGGLSMFLTPWAESQSKILRAEQTSQAKLGVFSAGRFRDNSNKDGVVFVESKSDDGVIKGVFSVSRSVDPENPNASRLKIQTAQQGRQWKNEKTGDSYLVLENGQFFEQSIKKRSNQSSNNQKTSETWQITDFETSYAKIILNNEIKIKSNTESASMFKLFNNGGNDEWAEIHWRLAAPISIPLIFLLAIPLSRTQPRKGKFSRLFPSVMIYLIYLLIMMYSRNLIKSGALPATLGFWWIHVGLSLFIYWLYRPIKKKQANNNKSQLNVEPHV